MTSFQHLEQYLTQRGKEGGSEREREGGREEVMGGKQERRQKREGRDDRGKMGGSRETGRQDQREEYVTEKKKKTHK